MTTIIHFANGSVKCTSKYDTVAYNSKTDVLSFTSGEDMYRRFCNESEMVQVKVDGEIIYDGH